MFELRPGSGMGGRIKGVLYPSASMRIQALPRSSKRFHALPQGSTHLEPQDTFLLQTLEHMGS